MDLSLRDDNTCSWGVIDVDRYNIQHQEIISIIRKRNTHCTIQIKVQRTPFNFIYRRCSSVSAMRKN